MSVHRYGFWGLLLAACLLAALGAGNPFGSDEVWSLRVIERSYSEMMTVLRGDVHPPLFYHLLLGWTRLFGASEWAVRSLTGLLYVLSLAAFFGLVRERLSSHAGFLAGVVFITSPLALLAAHFGRMYSLLLLVSVLSTWFYLRLQRERISPWEFAVYTTVNVAGTMTHLWFFFLLFAQLAGLAALRSLSVVRRTLFAIGLSLVPYAALWLPALVRQLHGSGETAAWLEAPTLGSIGSVVLMHGGAFWLLLPVALFAAWRSRRGEPPPSPAGLPDVAPTKAERPSLVWLLLALTLAVPFVISFAKPVFYSRFTIVALPLFALGVAQLLARRLGPRLTLQFAALLLVASSALALVSRLTAGRCTSRWTAQYLTREAGPGDVVIFTSLSRLAADHYLDRLMPQRAAWETSFPAGIDDHPGYEGAVLKDAEALRTEARLLAGQVKERFARSGSGRIFLLHGYRPGVDATLEPILAESFIRDETACIRCDQAQNYYYRISVYRVHPELVAHPSRSALTHELALGP